MCAFCPLWLLIIVCFVSSLYIGVVLIYVLGEDSTTVDVYTYINGIAAALIPIAVNLPQIWTTFKLKVRANAKLLTGYLLRFFRVLAP